MHMLRARAKVTRRQDLVFCMLRTVGDFCSLPLGVNAAKTTSGLGALASPLVATSFSHTRHWTFHYLVSTGLSVMNLLILMTVFRFKKQDGESTWVSFSYVQLLNTVCIAVLAEAGIAPAEVGTVDRSKYRQVFGIKTVHFLALFTLVYVGFEVTVGGG